MDKFEIYKLKQKQFTKYNIPTVSVGKKRRPTQLDFEEEDDVLNNDEATEEENKSTKSKLNNAPPQNKEFKKETKDDKAAEESARILQEKSGQVVTSYNKKLTVPSEMPRITSKTVKFPYNEQSIETKHSTMRFMYDSLSNRSKSKEIKEILFHHVTDYVKNRF